MMNRILIPVLLALGSLLLWALSPGGDEALLGEELGGVVRAAVPYTSVTEELPELVRVERSVARREVVEAVVPAPLERGEEDELEDARPDGSVLVEVYFERPGVGALGTPHPLAGATVSLQTWDQDTDETEPHAAEADAEGVARFTFGGDVHIDWFRAVAPPGAGALAAFCEPHVDISGGSLYRISLVPQLAGRLVGRVVALAGRGLAGVVVCAYLSEDMVTESGDGLAAWYPAHYRTESGPTGHFEFSALPPEQVFVGVGPGAWLQVSPQMGDDGSFCELEPGLERDIGSLRIVPREIVQLRVTDRLGQPVAAADIELEPRAFTDPRLLTDEDYERRTQGQDEGDEGELALPRDPWLATLLPWTHGVIERETDEEGRCSLALVGGTWHVRVRPWFGDERYVVEMDLELPQDELVFSVPCELSFVSGQVRGEGGAGPIEGAQVQLDLPDGRASTFSDARGEFEFPGAPIETSYQVRAKHSEYFPTQVELPATQLHPRLEMPAARRIMVRVLDQEGRSRVGQQLQLLRRLDGGRSTSEELAARKWAGRRSSPMQTRRTTSKGEVIFRQLHPGDYELGLLLPVATGAHDEWGKPIVEERVWQRWTVSTGPEYAPLVADLAEYRPVALTTYFSLKGTVRDGKTQAMLRGAEVAVRCESVTRSVVTDADGAFQMSVPLGRASFEASCPGYAPSVVTERMYTGNRVGHDFYLQTLEGE